MSPLQISRKRLLSTLPRVDSPPAHFNGSALSSVDRINWYLSPSKKCLKVQRETIFLSPLVFF